MKTLWTPETLLAFEEDIAQTFARGEITSPVHLSHGNELDLIEIFKQVRPEDWVLCGWRSHYHCLLKCVPAQELRQAILDGHSVSLCFSKYKILCSGIVGGIAPIAVGIAAALKAKNDEAITGATNKVWCFLGDMSFESGIVHESVKYARRQGLPIKFIVEDNGQSVCSPTHETWGDNAMPADVTRYNYILGQPHAGIGVHVRF